MREPIEKTCPVCGEKFQLHMYNHIFCSDKCRNKFYKQKLKKPAEKTCPVCGTRFKPDFGQQKYCSLKCKKKVYQDYKHYNYNYNPIPKQQNKQLKAGERNCLFCGEVFQTDLNYKFCSDECRLNYFRV